MMDTTVLAALITAAVSLALAIFSSWTSLRSQRSLEKLKSELAEQQAEKNARRDYEYEARKRLYHECEPLLFQLIEASETALSHIRGIAARVKAADGPLFSEQYYLKTTMYRLLLPCAVFKLITTRLTLVDLQVDRVMYAQYVLAKTVYFSYTDDFRLARLVKRLEYNPYVDDWRDKREQNPQVYRRQGFALGRLDNALDALIIGEEKTGYRFVSFGQFEEQFDTLQEGDVKSSLGTAKDLFFAFHPSTRPVLWRILIAQALLYRGILEFSRRKEMSSSEVLAFITPLPKEEMEDFDWRSAEQKGDDDTIFEPFDVAKVYLGTQLKRLESR
jgi:hypothetical protein